MPDMWCSLVTVLNVPTGVPPWYAIYGKIKQSQYGSNSRIEMLPTSGAVHCKRTDK